LCDSSRTSTDNLVRGALRTLQVGLDKAALSWDLGQLSLAGISPVLLMRKGAVELRMYKESTHQRPHFHIEYKTEYEASYALDTFEMLAGNMPRRYQDLILPWAIANQSLLLARWENLNGSVAYSLRGRAA
jgi:hypothetical protein